MIALIAFALGVLVAMYLTLPRPAAGLEGHYVLVRRGRREGQKGTVRRVYDDGTLKVDFKLGQGGGYEEAHYLPQDVEDLGVVKECPIRNPGHAHLAQDCPEGIELLKPDAPAYRVFTVDR